MKSIITIALLIVLMISCKSKKAKPEVEAADFFPVTSYIKGEVSRLDTSLASFTKIETANGRSDTTPIKNSEVRRYASDFLSLPDISTADLKDDYEVTHLYDDMLDAFVFTFTTKEPHTVKREDVVLEPAPDEAGKNQIKSIFVERWDSEGNSPVRKNMLWEAGKRFSITTTSNGNDSASVKKLQVMWNGFATANR